MRKNLKQIFALFLAFVLLLGMMPTARAMGEDRNGGANIGNDPAFEQMLETLRREHFSRGGSRPFGAGLRTIINDGPPIPHMPPRDIEPEWMQENARGIQPFFSPENYVVGSRRPFFASGLTPTTGHMGQLVRQGEHVNIWILDNVTANRPSEAELNEAIIMYDEITYRMTRDLGAFRDVRVTTPFVNMPLVGDVHNDGRVNVLMHTGFGGGYFWSMNFTISDHSAGNPNVPIAVFHINPNHWNSASLFAHELQHLLFFMHFGVYAEFSSHYLWFNEALSMLAGVYWAEDGAKVLDIVRIWQATENSYANPNDSRAGSFTSFNNSGKSYGMSMMHAKLMHDLANVCYAGAIYDFFAERFPPAATPEQFMNNRSRISAVSPPSGMHELIGDAFYSAGLTGGASGSLAFNLMYFIFMEAFAADGGAINGHVTPALTPAFVNSPFSAHRLWGIRPNLGPGNNVFQNETGGGFNLSAQTFLSQGHVPTLASGGTVSMRSFNTSDSEFVIGGTTMDRLYRLAGEGTANPILNISINDNNSLTRYYVVVPNDILGAISSPANRTLGSQGATVHPINANGTANLINTGGQTAYLFIATLNRLVNTTATYSWQAEMPPEPTEYLQINGAGQYATRATFQTALQTALNAAPSNSAITVTGSLTNTDGAALDITIPENRTVLWNAAYSCDGTGRLIGVRGDGTFIVGPDGGIISTNVANDATHGILIFDTASVTVDGGIVENNSQSSAIFVSSEAAALTIEDGIVRTNATDRPAIVTNGQVVLNGGTVQASGVGSYVIAAWETSTLAINGGTIIATVNAENAVLVRDTSVMLLTNTGASALAAGGRINRLGNATAYFIGDHAARFNGFTLDENLFRLDVPTLLQIDSFATATLSERLTFFDPENSATVNGVPPTGFSTLGGFHPLTIIFGGTFSADNITITITGATLAGGRINVPTFTTVPFAVNVGGGGVVVPQDAPFFYVINYTTETISFGQNFRFAQIDPVTREYLRDASGNHITQYASRSQISFIFNRRADRIRPDRGNWVMTLTGESDISRHLRRGGYIGVRRRLPSGQHELMALIPLQARPPHRELRAHRRNIYEPTRMINDVIQRGDRLQNPTDNTLEIRIGNDRFSFGRPTVIATERLEPGAPFPFPHDSIPRGMRGTFRIAPQEAVNFVEHNGELRWIRDWIYDGVEYVDGVGNLQNLIDEGGSFGSATVRFSIPNQPAAPATNRMLMTPGRNGAPYFISRTNRNMRVLLGYDGDNSVWGQLEPNISIREFIDLFENDGRPLPENGDYYEFRIRFFRNNRVVSAPGYLHVRRDDFRENTLIHASVTPTAASQGIITGTEGVALRNHASNNIIITTTNARANVARNDDVTSWFNLPTGLTATVSAISGARITIQIRGTATQVYDEPLVGPLVINIPAGVLTVDAFEVLNEDADGNPIAEFNITPASEGEILYVPVDFQTDYEGNDLGE